MKRLLVLVGILALGWSTGIHNSALALFGFSSARYAISSDDPLGTPIAIHHYLSSVGFEGELGTVNSPRTISFTSKLDQKRGADFAGGINITVGDEEYVQKISAAFVGTQHGYTPQRASQVEQEISALWNALGGGHPSFKKVSDGRIDFPNFRTQSGNRIAIPMSHMEANFSTNAVQGHWLYSENNPMEVMEFWLK
ncbi:MAG: hypothetical protein K1X79_02660 [Oligoflexia bacterium]|nr:hypothetical protein [Oligoflexia bacterium]